MLARYSAAVVTGALVTFGVIFTMQALIATARGELEESEPRHFVDFVRVEREETLERKERKVEKPVQPDPPPDDPVQQRVDSVDPTQVSVSVPDGSIEMDMAIEGLGLAPSDGDYLPMVKIAPAYPVSALTRRIEGYCCVEYTVTPNGRVKDVFVVDAKPKKVFDKTSIKAALKFKYRPRFVNGEAIEVRGVRNIFYYKLEQ
jgi:protein TonB